MSSKTAFKYRMPGGIPGDINRTHPASVEPCAMDPDAPVLLYGQAVLVDATSQGVRPFSAGDIAVVKPWGVAARPYPIGVTSGSIDSNFGAGTPPPNQPIDVMTLGYMTVTVPAGQAPVKGGAVYVWCAASGGGHVQGGFEAQASGGNTAALDPNTYAFNGSPDADGNVEIRIAP